MSEAPKMAGTSTVVCDECGSNNEWGTAFCGACGAYLDWDGQPPPEEPVAAPAAPAPSADVTPEPTLAPESSVPPESPASPESSVAPEVAVAPEAAVPAATAPEPAVAREANTKPEVLPGSAARSAAPKQPAPQKPAPQQPAARQPAAEVKPKPKKPAPTHNEPPLRPGDLVCGKCGTGNAPGRNFCRRCGAPLADAAVVPADPWWRRLFSTRSSAPAAGTRPQVRRRSKLPGRLVALAIVAAVVYGIAAYAWPWWKGGVQDSVLDRVSGTQRYEPTTVGASSSAPQHPAALLRDGNPDTYWTPAGRGGGTNQYVQATFDKPFRLVAVQIFNGSSRQDKEYLTTGRPANVMLTITKADGSVERRALTLRDEPTQQDHLIGISDVTRVRMTVRSAFGATTKTRIAVGEVAYFTRG